MNLFQILFPIDARHLFMRCSSFALISLFVFGLSSCATYKREFKPLTENQAARIAPYAMMAANAYHHKCEWFPLAKLGWVQIDRAGKPTDKPTYSQTFSLAYDVFQNDRRHEYVFVYRGTDSALDAVWSNLAPFVSPGYASADSHFDKFLQTRQFQKYKVILAGHSLGAGLALHKAVRGYDAYLFDPSPRIFGPPARNYRPGKRVAVFQTGEILTILRRHTSLWHTAATAGTYEEDFTHGEEAKRKHGLGQAIALHSMFKLAEHIRAKGAVVDPRLKVAKLSSRPGPGCPPTPPQP